MKRIVTMLFLAALIFLYGCTDADKPASGSPYDVNLTNVVTKKTYENEYRSLGTKGISYSVTGDVSLLRAGKPEEVSGDLILSVSETTGFLSYGDEPRFYRVPIVKGKGYLEVELVNTSIPLEQPSPSLPKIVIREGNFLKYEDVNEVVNREVKSSEKAVKLDVSPLRVVKDGSSYLAEGELNVTGLGSLSKSSFFLFVLQTTLEHPEPDKVGKRQVYQFVVNKGSGKIYDSEYLGLSGRLDQGLKGLTAPIPSVPKYKYDIMGIQMAPDVLVETK